MAVAEISLKDESVIEIGQSVTKGFNDLVNSGKSVLINPAGQPLTSSAADVPANDDFIGPSMPQLSEESGVMQVLKNIRDGIVLLTETFIESLSFQKQEEKEKERADRVSADDTPPPPSDEGGDEKGGFLAGAMKKFASLKDGAKSLMGKGGFMGLLIKGGLIAGLLLLAKGLQKYGKQIAEKLTPIVDGIKAFFSVFMDNVGPLFDSAIAMIKDAVGGLLDIFKGLFTGDGSTFLGGIKKLFIDFPIKLVSYIGDAFFSLLEAGLAAFGIESEMVTNIKNFFRDLPANISQMFTDIGLFFTETIPAKVTEIKDSVKKFFTDAFDNIKNGFKDAISSVGDFFSGIGDKIKTVINSAIEALPLPDFIKKKLKFETKATKAAGDAVNETGVKSKYADSDITGMKRERMTGGGATMDEGFAEAAGEKYGKAKITKSGTDGYDFAEGIMTPAQFKEFNKLDTDGQLEYLKNLDEEEQKRRDIIMKLKQDKIDHDKKLAKLIEEGKALQPEFGGEITSPDDQMLQDDMAYSKRTKQMKEDSAAMANRDAGKVNVISNKGGATNTSVANNSYTNIAESTNTSDGSLREAFSA